MIDDRYRIEPADWIVDQQALKAVRTAVFIVEQNIPPDDEWDDLDPKSRHVVARLPDGTPIGTGRLTPDFHVGRIAVTKEWRGKGVGAALVEALVQLARELGWTEVVMHAQSHAVALYAKLGFVAEGAEFEECGIPHRFMRRRLEPIEQPPSPGAIARQRSQRVDVNSRDDATIAVGQLLSRARHRLWIVSRDLDPELLDRSPVLEAIRRIALSGRGAEVRILLFDSEIPIGRGHRLLHLAERLSSHLTIRRPVDEVDRHYAAAFILNDDNGYFYRPLASRFDGEYDPVGGPRHRPLLEWFNQVWERSEADPNLRRLGV